MTEKEINEELLRISMRRPLPDALEDTDTSYLVTNQFHSTSPARPRSASMAGYRTDSRCTPLPPPDTPEDVDTEQESTEPVLTTVVQCEPLDELVVFVAAESGFPIRDSPQPDDLNEPTVVRHRGMFSPGTVLKSTHQRPQYIPPRPSSAPAHRRKRVRSKKIGRRTQDYLIPEMSSFIVPVPKCSTKSTLNGRPMSACSTTRTCSTKRVTKPKKRPQSACARLGNSRIAPKIEPTTSQLRPATAGLTGRVSSSRLGLGARPQSAPASPERKVLQQMSPLSGAAKQRAGILRNHLAWGHQPKPGVEVGVVALGCMVDGIRGDQVNRSELSQVHSPKFVGGIPHRCRRVQGSLSYDSFVRQF